VIPTALGMAVIWYTIERHRFPGPPRIQRDATDKPVGATRAGAARE
jgi:hypothetical protein